jgi:hypothetical protein
MKHLVRFNESNINDKYRTLSDILVDIFDRHDIQFYDRDDKSNEDLIGENL